MIAITKYVANDNSEWNTSEGALKRDALIAVVQPLHERLGPHIEHGRRRINPKTYALVKADVVALCRKMFPRESVFQHAADEIHPMSYAGRFLSEVGGPLNKIWWRFSCVDGDWEYEQPFFALNPGEYERQYPERVASERSTSAV